MIVIFCKDTSITLFIENQNDMSLMIVLKNHFLQMLFTFKPA